MYTKGLSMIIASVLTVLLTVAAVSLLWVGTQPVLEKASMINGAQGPYFEIQKEFSYTVYDPENGYMSVQVERGGDTQTVIKLKFIINIKGTSVVRETYDVVDPLQRQVYYFVMDKNLDDIGPVKVVPVYYINGEEVEGGEYVLETKIPIRPGALRDLILEGVPMGTNPADSVARGENDLMYISLHNTGYDLDNGLLTLQLVRGDDEQTIDGMKFDVAMSEDGNEVIYSILTDTIPRSNSVKTYYIPVWKGKTITSITVTPYQGEIPLDPRVYKDEALLVDSITFSSSEVSSLPITFEKNIGHTDGLVFYYSFDDNYIDEVNNRIIDQSGFGHEGVLRLDTRNEAEWNDLFNGNNYIYFGGGTETLYPLGDKTITFWAKPTKQDTNNRFFGAKFNYNLNFFTNPQDSKTSLLVGYENNGFRFFEFFYDETIQNNWRFYALVFSVSENKIVAYLGEGTLLQEQERNPNQAMIMTNNVPEPSETLNVLAPDTSLGGELKTLFVGSYGSGDPNRPNLPDLNDLYEGDLAEFRIYDGVLDENEIGSIYGYTLTQTHLIS